MTARRILLAGLLLFAAFPAVAEDKDKVHRLALQISDDSPDKMNTVLGNATNAARYYSEKGEKLEIKVVAYSGGVNMLRTDKSPVLDRLKEVSQKLPNLTFEACNNTIEGMAKKEDKKPSEIPLVPGTKVVPAGVVELMELNEAGWTIVRP
jgi:intracellular sulfur oxidation DsrE/DsrF family protein